MRGSGRLEWARILFRLIQKRKVLRKYKGRKCVSGRKELIERVLNASLLDQARTPLPMYSQQMLPIFPGWRCHRVQRQNNAAIPEHSPIRFQAATCLASAPCIHSPFSYVSCQRSSQSPTLPYAIPNHVDPDVPCEWKRVDPGLPWD